MFARVLFALVCLPSVTAAASDLLGFWDGSKTISVSLRVLDGVGETPVMNAEIWLITGEDVQVYRRAMKNPKYRGKLQKPIEALGVHAHSDSNGEATLQSDFHGTATIERNDGVEKRKGTWRVQGRVEVRAAGYDDYVADLEKLLPKGAYDLNQAETSLVIRLTRKATKAGDQTSASRPEAQDVSRLRSSPVATGSTSASCTQPRPNTTS